MCRVACVTAWRPIGSGTSAAAELGAVLVERIGLVALWWPHPADRVRELLELGGEVKVDHIAAPKREKPGEPIKAPGHRSLFCISIMRPLPPRRQSEHPPQLL
jgi:hypothetical protein